MLPVQGPQYDEQCLHCYSFIISLAIWQYKDTSFALHDCLSYSEPFTIPYEFPNQPVSLKTKTTETKKLKCWDCEVINFRRLDVLRYSVLHEHSIPPPLISFHSIM